MFQIRERRDASFEMFAETPAGRRIWVIWRYDKDEDEVFDAIAEPDDVPIFVITAY